MEKLHYFRTLFMAVAIIAPLAYSEEDGVTYAATLEKGQQETSESAKDKCISSIGQTFGDMTMLYADRHLADTREDFLTGLHSLARNGFEAIIDLMQEVRNGQQPIEVENSGTFLLPNRKILCNKTVVDKLGDIVTEYLINREREAHVLHPSNTSKPQVISV